MSTRRNRLRNISVVFSVFLAACGGDADVYTETQAVQQRDSLQLRDYNPLNHMVTYIDWGGGYFKGKLDNWFDRDHILNGAGFIGGEYYYGTCDITTVDVHYDDDGNSGYVDMNVYAFTHGEPGDSHYIYCAFFQYVPEYIHPDNDYAFCSKESPSFLEAFVCANRYMYEFDEVSFIGDQNRMQVLGMGTHPWSTGGLFSIVMKLKSTWGWNHEDAYYRGPIRLTFNKVLRKPRVFLDGDLENLGYFIEGSNSGDGKFEVADRWTEKIVVGRNTKIRGFEQPNFKGNYQEMQGPLIVDEAKIRSLKGWRWSVEAP